MQTWTRTAVTNDKELAEIAKMSYGLISNKSILKYHPNVDNVDDEIEQINKEQQEADEKADLYESAFTKNDGDIKDGKEE